MESLSKLLNKLRPNHPEFKKRFLDISSIYNAPFDSDTIKMYLQEGTLFVDDKKEWKVLIPNMVKDIESGELEKPRTVQLRVDDPLDDKHTFVSIPFPYSIEEFRAMARGYGVAIRLNNDTANLIYGI